MKKTLFITLIYSFFASLNVFAQYGTQKMTKSLFASESGLSSTKITCIMQDNRSLLWIGTEDGLNKFNGYDFIIYKKIPNDTLSLISNQITSLYQDSRNRLWVGTSAGLEYYDLKYDGFINVSLNRDDRIAKENPCNVILEDSRGSLWFSFPEYGVIRYSPETEESTLFSRDPTNSSFALCSNFITSIIEDTKGKIWFASEDNGLSVYDPAESSFNNFNKDNSPLSNNTINDLYVFSDGNILISTLRDGLVIYDMKENKFLTYKDVFDSSYTRMISCAGEDHDGNILVGTNGNGLFIFDPETRKLTEHPLFSELSGLIGKSNVTYICKGNFTYTWVALNYKGVFVFGYENSGFKSFSHSNSNENSLSNGAVTSIITEKDGTLWVATDGGGLNSYIPSTQKFIHYRYDPQNEKNISDNAVMTVFCDSKGRIWAGTRTGGLCLFNKESETFTRFRKQNGAKGLQSNYISSIQEDKDGFLWLGTGGGGLTRFDPQAKEFKTFTSHKNPGLAGDDISILFIDSKNRLWIGTHSGLSCMDLASGTFRSYNQSTGLSNLSIYSIAEDDRGEILIGTAYGLNKYNPETDNITGILPQMQENYNPVINGIIPDGENIWLSTNHGVVLYVQETDELKAYYANSGLQNNEFIAGAYYKDPGGKMFFGGVNGLNMFYPKDIHDSDITPQVYITKLSIYNEPVSINEKISGHIILTQNIETTERIKLKHNDKNLTLEFLAMGVFDPYAAIYECKMEGFDKEWFRYDYTHRSVTYTNLSPGTYTFRVRASSSPDVWGDEEASLTIVIEPAIWDTWWAKTIYCILALFIIYLIFKLFLTRVREKNELRIERLRIKQQEELNLAKTNFFMNITHEFRTPLTLVIGPLERLISEDDATKRKQTGQMIFRNVSRLQRLINQILDVNKIVEHKMLLHVEQIELVSFVSHTISAFDEITQKKNISLTYTCESERIIIWYDPDWLDKALNNILYNAYKFTDEGGKIAVDIKENKEGSILLTISDTGIGMDEETKKNIFDRFAQGRKSNSLGTGIGMNLTKAIIDLHKGSISVESEEGKGSTFYVTIRSGNEHFSKEELVTHKADSQETEETDFWETTLYDENTSASPDKRNEDNQPPKEERRYTILLVEDDNDMRHYVRQELESEYKIIEAVNGKIGLEMANKSMPDLVITDVMMPEMDGIEMSHILRTNPETSHIPIVILTAQSDLGHRLEGLETGADSYIAKPFSVRYLKIRIRKLIELRRIMKDRFSKSINMDAQQITLTSTDERLLQNAIDYVRNNIENTDLSVEGMSKHLGLSRTHLHRKLKALTGQSPVDFIKMIRMKQAAYLLSTGKLSVSEVGYKVGYNTPSYFSSSFNAYFGMSPSAYIDKAMEEKTDTPPPDL